jgi:hypothetical protein
LEAIMAVPTVSVPSFFPSDPQQDKPRSIDNVIGLLLRSLEVLGAAQSRVAAELAASPLTIQELKRKSGILTADEVLENFARRSRIVS